MKISDPVCSGCHYEYPELSKRNLCQNCEDVFWLGYGKGYLDADESYQRKARLEKENA